MDGKNWESSIAINSCRAMEVACLPAASHFFRDLPDPLVAELGRLGKITELVARDISPLPFTEDREGYYGDDHYMYWISGLQDLVKVLEVANSNGCQPTRFLDFGCASGRFLRHPVTQISDAVGVGIDINGKHVDWCNWYLPATVKAIGVSSIPRIPVEPGTFDVVTAFSVFTHIDSFELAWLSEVMLALRPGGIAYLTVHTDNTWLGFKDTWPLYNAVAKHPLYSTYDPKLPLPTGRTLFRWHADKSYSSNVFFSEEYIRRVWGRFGEIVEIKKNWHDYQDVVVVKKRA